MPTHSPATDLAMHTAEPWAQNGHRIESRDEHGVANDGWIVAQCEGSDAEWNTRRIVACVNALAGVPTEWLEGFTLNSVENVVQENAQLRQQRDDLLAALLGMLGSADEHELDGMESAMELLPASESDRRVTINAIRAARAVLARAEDREVQG